MDFTGRRRAYDEFNDNDGKLAANYPLNKQILDYYYCFGRERNLERYLKLNRSLSKSSSDSSLDHYHYQRSRHLDGRPKRPKSMEHLPRRGEKKIQTEEHLFQTCPSRHASDPKDISASEPVTATAGNGDKGVSVTKKNRSYQINVESKVEIAFPNQFYRAMAQATSANPSRESVAVGEKDGSIHYANRTESRNAPLKVDHLLDPISELCPAAAIERPLSPTSSIASNKQKLEWDSLADVGYGRSQSEPKTNNFSDCKTASPLVSRSMGAIPKKTASSKSEKWKQLLIKVKQKKPIDDASSRSTHEPSPAITFDAEMSALAHSTPMQSLVLERPDAIERSSQTSDIAGISRSVQAICERADKSTTMSSNRDSTATSFEYVQAPRMVVDRSGTESEADEGKSSARSKQTDTLRIRNEISEYLANVTQSGNAGKGVALDRAVHYIAMLYDSKSIDRKMKKELVEKIIGKLLRSTSKPDAVTTNASSRNGTRAATIRSVSQDYVREDVAAGEMLANWLKPMTMSEVLYDQVNSLQQKPDNEPARATVECPSVICSTSKRIGGSSNSTSSSSNTGGSFQNKFKTKEEKETHLQLKCIEKEIEYLERIKKLIQYGRMNLNDDTKKNMDAVRSRAATSNTTVESSLLLSSTPSVTRLSDWDSHRNLQLALAKLRGRLKTPELTLPVFVQQRTLEFAQRYENRSKYYSEPNADMKNRPQKPLPVNCVNASTSVNSCEFSSVGTAFNGKDSSTMASSASQLMRRRTHLTSKEESALNFLQTGTQTTDSIMLSAPIFGPARSHEQRCGCGRRSSSCDCTARTRCVVRLQHNKILQTKPESISYTIVLGKERRAETCSETNTRAKEQPATMAQKTDELLTVCGGGSRLRLEDYLKQNRPDFIEHAEERKVFVEAVKRRRAYKNKEKENLLQSSSLPKHKINKLLENSVQGDATVLRVILK